MAASVQGSGEVRRVQRLGSSSLVVTLPKSWVKNVNLRPGDPVVVVVEGKTVRILPVESGSESAGGAVYRFPDVTSSEAYRLLRCAYVLGLDELAVGGSDDVYEALREAALNLVGVDVARDDGGVRVSVIIDQSRLDARSSIRSIAGDLERIFRSLVEALRRDIDEGEVARLTSAMRRSMSLVERYLISSLALQVSTYESKMHVNMLIAAHFLGLAASSLLEALQVALAKKVRNPALAERIESLSKIALEAGLNVASPSVKRSNEVLAATERAKSELSELIMRGKTTREEAIILALVREAVKHLQISTTLCYCTARILRSQQ